MIYHLAQLYGQPMDASASWKSPAAWAWAP